MKQLVFKSKNIWIYLNGFLVLINALSVIGVSLYFYEDLHAMALFPLSIAVVGPIGFYICFLRRATSRIALTTTTLSISNSFKQRQTFSNNALTKFVLCHCNTVKLFYSDRRNPIIFSLKYFYEEQRIEIFSLLTAVTDENRAKMGELELQELTSRNQFNLKKIASHSPSFYGLFLVSWILPLVGFVMLVYDCLVATSWQCVLAKVDFSLLTSFLLPIAVILFDKMSAKRILELDNGALRLKNQFTILKEVDLTTVYYFHMDSYSLKWSLPNAPQSIYTIHLMCFNRKDRKDIIDKVGTLMAW